MKITFNKKDMKRARQINVDTLEHVYVRVPSDNLKIKL